MSAHDLPAPPSSASKPPFTNHLLRLLPGLALSVAIGLASIQLAQLDWMREHGLSALVIAIVLGMLLGNTVYPNWHARCDAGVGLSKQALLRAGIVLYGLQLTLQDVARIGWAGVALDLTMLCSTFTLAVWLGTRWLKLERTTAVLIGAGSSICGAAAVLATGPVAKARADQVAVAVSTVVIFGTLAVFIYPALHSAMAQWVNTSADLNRYFGLYIGSTVHEVAQVVAAARNISTETGNDAVVAKLVRVLMLAPFLAVLSWWLVRGRFADTANTATDTEDGTTESSNNRITIPWFAVAFMAVVALNSLFSLPAELAHALAQLDSLMLSAAMAALGLTTHYSAIRRAGIKPMLLAGVLFAWLLVVGGSLTWLAVWATA